MLILRTASIVRLAGAVAVLSALGACSPRGLSADAKIVADACSKQRGYTVEKCTCFAGELQSKLTTEQLHMAALGQSDLKALYEYARKMSADDTFRFSKVGPAALKTCGLSS